MSDTIARTFYSSGTTQTVACAISKATDRVRSAGLLAKLKTYGVLGRAFRRISFYKNRCLGCSV